MKVLRKVLTSAEGLKYTRKSSVGLLVKVVLKVN